MIDRTKHLDRSGRWMVVTHRRADPLGGKPCICCLILCGFAAMTLLGCQTRQPPPSSQENQAADPDAVADTATKQHTDMATQPQQITESASRSVLSEAEIAAIQQEIEASGGKLTRNRHGQPVEIDLARDRSSASPAAFDAAIQCVQLKKLRLRAPELPATAFRDIESLAHLEELWLQDAAVQDETLQALTRHLPMLRRLTLRNTPAVSHAGLAAVAGLPRLTHLALISLPVSRSAIASFAESPSLVALDLRMCHGFDQADLERLTQAPELKDLKLGGPGIDNRACQAVASLPHLSSLAVEDASIDAEGIQTLAAEPAVAERLRSLAFARCYGLDDNALKGLAKFTQLRALMLRDIPVTGSFLAALPARRQLERLTLNQTFLSDEAFPVIASCKNLKRLELAANLLNPSAVKLISTLSQLEYLDVSDCGLDDQSIQPLSRLPNLRTLRATGNTQVREQTLQQIVGDHPLP